MQQIKSDEQKILDRSKNPQSDFVRDELKALQKFNRRVILGEEYDPDRKFNVCYPGLGLNHTKKYLQMYINERSSCHLKRGCNTKRVRNVLSENTGTTSTADIFDLSYIVFSVIKRQLIFPSAFDLNTIKCEKSLKFARCVQQCSSRHYPF